MVHIRRSETNKVTLEYTLEELSLVENDLDVLVNEYDLLSGDPPSDATYEMLEKIKAFWIGMQPPSPFDNPNRTGN